MRAKRDHQLMERRRLRAAAMFERGSDPAEVARCLKVSRESAGRWHQAWKANGRKALASKGSAGRKPRLNTEQRSDLVEALVEGPAAQGYSTNLWTLPRVALLIEKLTGVRYHPGHVWHLLRALGLSCQRPTRRAIERDEAKIAHWKRSIWPALKKKPAAKGGLSSLSTKAD
jgi:transposase